MIYRGITITAEVETYETWDIDDEGRPSDFISNNDGMDVAGYFFESRELGIYEFVSSSETDLSQLKEIADDFIKAKEQKNG